MGFEETLIFFTTNLLLVTACGVVVLFVICALDMKTALSLHVSECTIEWNYKYTIVSM